jgi:hypothetical protein
MSKREDGEMATNPNTPRVPAVTTPAEAMDEDFIDYLDRWLQAQGVLMHTTTLERIADGAEEFYKGRQLSYEQWQDAPRGPDNRVIHDTGESTP